MMICKQTHANVYLSGPSAKDYLDESLFVQHDISLIWMDYSGYSEYEQLNLPFEHGISILDLIFNKGNEAPFFLKNVIS